MIEIQTQGDINNLRYLLEKIRNKTNPICNNNAVYLELKANPIAIPPSIQKSFFSSKIALYKLIKLKVQNNNKGTSGVELKDKMETNMVDTKSTKVLCNFCLDKKYEANL